MAPLSGQPWYRDRAIRLRFAMATRPIDFVGLLDPVSKDLFLSNMDPSVNARLSVVVAAVPGDNRDIFGIVADSIASVGRFLFGGAGVNQEDASYSFDLQDVSHNEVYKMLRTRLGFGDTQASIYDLLNPANGNMIDQLADQQFANQLWNGNSVPELNVQLDWGDGGLGNDSSSNIGNSSGNNAGTDLNPLPYDKDINK
jgi:hypothetical protein